MRKLVKKRLVTEGAEPQETCGIEMPCPGIDGARSSGYAEETYSVSPSTPGVDPVSAAQSRANRAALRKLEGPPGVSSTQGDLLRLDPPKKLSSPPSRNEQVTRRARSFDQLFAEVMNARED